VALRFARRFADMNDWRYTAAESTQHVPWVLAMMQVARDKIFGVDWRLPLPWLVTNFVLLVSLIALAVYRIDALEKRETSRDGRILLLEANHVTASINIRELQTEGKVFGEQQRINTGLIHDMRVGLAKHEAEDVRHENDDLKHQLDQARKDLRERNQRR